MKIAGFVLHLLLFPVFLTSGLVVPWYAMGGLLVLWVIAAVIAVKNRDNGRIVLAVPIVSFVILVAVVSLGGWLLDWTA